MTMFHFFSFLIIIISLCNIHLSTSQTCTTSLTGDISSYTVSAAGSCGDGVDCIDGYDCEVTCSSYSCSSNIYGPNSGYDLTVDCSNDFACQRSVINAENDNSDGDIYVNCDAGYTCESSLYTTLGGNLDLDCTGNRGCAHFIIYAQSSATSNSFSNIDVLCQGSTDTNSHVCYDFTIDGGSWYRGNLNMLCDDTNACQNSNIDGPMFGSVTIKCANTLSCAGSSLATIANNDVVGTEIINNYASGYGTFECTGSISCQGTTIYCPNYKDCSVLCDATTACDGTVIYCPKYGGICNVDCSNGCNSVMLYSYNDNYNIISGAESVTVSNTVIDMTNINIVEDDGGNTGGNSGGGSTNGGGNTGGGGNTVDDDGSGDGNDGSSSDGDSGSDGSGSDGSGASNSNANDDSSDGGGIGLDHGTSAVVAFVIVLSIILVLAGAGFVYKRMQGQKQVNNSGGNHGDHVLSSDGHSHAEGTEPNQTNIVYAN